jgi:two-component system, OmpR family, KDP operon response regulator KdpE
MTTQPLVLAVDDEPGVLRLIKLELTALDFRVVTTSDPREALHIMEEQRPDVILLDVLMPEMSGLEMLREIRERRDTPVIFVSAKDRDIDKVRGLELGGDDYVVKPFSADELAARIRAVLRRHVGVGQSSEPLRADGLEIDFDRRTVRRGEEDVALTRTEWMLLQFLASKPGKVLLNAELLSHVWGPEYRDDLQYLRVWVSRLRKKIERDPSNPMIIKTMPGIGYQFLADEAAETNA